MASLAPAHAANVPILVRELVWGAEAVADHKPPKHAAETAEKVVFVFWIQFHLYLSLFLWGLKLTKSRYARTCS